MKPTINNIKNIALKHKKTSIVIILVLIFSGWKIFAGGNSSQPQYQTEQVEKGTLVTSVSASGSIATGGNLPITTAATGTVSTMYVKNGDTVIKGQKITDITLDQDSQQKQASAWSSYLQAQNSLNSAQSKINSLQAALFKANQTFINDKGINNPTDQQKSDPVYIQENASWLQAEADYKNQTGVINQAQSGLNNAWLSYQQINPTITSPSDGIVANLTIAEGSIISPQTTSSSNNNSGNSLQKLGVITIPQNNIQAIVNLSEMDVAKVTPGKKVTLTLDAFPGKTFTGKVLIINTNGQVSTGVTTYPATIVFDTSEKNIYTNMAVSANIIINIKNDVLLVSSGALQTQSDGSSTIRILKNGQLNTVSVEVGDSSDTQTEIISGLNEGNTIVTAVVNPVTATGQNGTSPFSGGGFGGGRSGFGGGNAVRGATGR